MGKLVVKRRKKPPPKSPPTARGTYARCGAMTKRGVPCAAPAGRGTDHLGYGQCRAHGGMTPNNRKSALAAEARHRLISHSIPVEDASPHVVLMQELQWSTGHISALLEEIEESWESGKITERTRLALDRFDAERDRRTRVAEACSRVGVDEAMMRIREAQALQLVQAITVAAREAGIPAAYVTALGPALRRQMALASGDQATAEAAERKVAELRERIAEHEERRIERKVAERPPADLVYPPEEWVAEPPSAA